jgi:hypothetical protein
MSNYQEFTEMIEKAYEIVKDRVVAAEIACRDKPVREKATMICVDEAIYGDWIGEIARIKPKKRKNWSSHLTDQWGQRTRVRYEDKKFWNWSTLVKEWCEVTTSDRLERLHKSKGGEGGIPCSYVGWVRCIAMELRKMGVSQDITEAMCAAALERKIAENETHNHYRNHFVNVGKDVYG